MSKTGFSVALAVLLSLTLLGPSHAALFTENFNDATTIDPPVDTGNTNYSEKWNPTYYYNGSDPQWTFSGWALVATNDTGTDKAVLLNEWQTHGSILSVNISGLVSGNQYLLLFDHWGDNRPNDPAYWFRVSIDDTINNANILSQDISRDYNYAAPGGSGAGVTENIYFTAPSTTITLKFTDITTVGEASAIIDNISISAVPIPAAFWLLGSGLMSLVAIRRKLKK